MADSRRKKKFPRSSLTKEQIEELYATQTEGDENTIEEGNMYSTYKNLQCLTEVLNVDEDGVLVSRKFDTGHVRCTVCEAILSKGGQLARHACSKREDTEKVSVAREVDVPPNNRKITEYSICKLTETKKKQVLEIIVDYCLKTGKSFHHLGSNEFKNFVVQILRVNSPGLNYKELLRQMPTRNTIQAYGESKAKEMLSQIFSKLVPHFEDKRVAILVDFGKQSGGDFLSVCLSYLDDGGGIWKLRVLPISFRPWSGDVKGADEVYSELCEIGTDIGIGVHLLSQCWFVSDGAANLKKCGEENFSGYVRCSNHALNKLAERTLRPYRSDQIKFDGNEQFLLDLLNDLVRDCRTVAIAVRGEKKIASKLSKLPNAGVETRWLSFVSCVDDIYCLLDTLIANISYFSRETRRLIMKLSDHKMHLQAMRTVVGPLLQHNFAFQSEDISIHIVAPLFRRMMSTYLMLSRDALPPGIQDLNHVDSLRVLSKAAHIATLRHYDDITPLHLAAVMLTPATKKMKAFEDNEIEEAKSFIRMVLCDTSSAQAPPRNATPKPRKLSTTQRASQELADESSEDESVPSMTSEFDRYLIEKGDKSEPVASFWLRKKSQFPQLYKTAVRIFGVLSSEAACERSFSVSSNVISKSRSSLYHENIDWIVSLSLILKSNSDLLSES